MKVVSKLLLALLLGMLAPRTVAQAVDEARPLAALGERLFNEARLSADGRISCASCHRPELAFSDGAALPSGIGAQVGNRNTPSLVGLVDSAPMFWDGRQSNLERLILEPMLNPREHGLASLDDLDARLRKLHYLRKWPLPEGISRTEHAASAIAQFLLGLQPEASTLARVGHLLNPTTEITAEQRGAALFNGRAGCSGCHLLAAASIRLTDSGFHDHGVSRIARDDGLSELLALTAAATEPVTGGKLTPRTAALGRYLVTGLASDIGKFKTPSLFNVAITSPYMHDGSIATLEQAVEHEIYYSAADHGAGLGVEDRFALLAFLRALTDERYAHLVERDTPVASGPGPRDTRRASPARTSHHKP